MTDYIYYEQVRLLDGNVILVPDPDFDPDKPHVAKPKDDLSVYDFCFADSIPIDPDSAYYKAHVQPHVDTLDKCVAELLPFQADIERHFWLSDYATLRAFLVERGVEWCWSIISDFAEMEPGVDRYAELYEDAFRRIVPDTSEDDYRARTNQPKLYVDTQESKMSAQQPEQSAQLPPPPVIQTAAALQKKHFDPVRFVIQTYIAEGLTILAGKPKIGKSWLVLDAALAVASGGQFFGTKAEQGDVLYLALEDSERRLKNRITKIIGPFVEFPKRFHFATKWPRADEGGLDKIREWITSVSQPRLIVVDVLARFRAPQNSRAGVYEQDYKAIADLQAIASEKNIALVVVHHLRKSAGETDAFDTISGTLGLVGAADGALILAYDGQGTTLYLRGRDVEEVETAVRFDKGRCRWEVLGLANDVRRSEQRKVILKALHEGGGPMARNQIVSATGMLPNSVDQLLWKMIRNGEVKKVGRGTYQAVALPPPPGGPLTPSDK